jgi:hypothetical protein
MATPANFPEANDDLGKPSNMTDDQCVSLPICRMLAAIPAADSDNHILMAAHFSFWKFSDEEWEEVVKNRGVYVRILAPTNYPMLVTGYMPIFSEDQTFTRDQIMEFKKRLENEKNNRIQNP